MFEILDLETRENILSITAMIKEKHRSERNLDFAPLFFAYTKSRFSLIAAQFGEYCLVEIKTQCNLLRILFYSDF